MTPHLTGMMLTDQEWRDLAKLCTIYRSAVGCSELKFVPERDLATQRAVMLALKLEVAGRQQGACTCSGTPFAYLRDLMNAYLRTCDGWQEHPAHPGTVDFAPGYLQWEDLRCPDGPMGGRFLPTDLAATRQMTYEANNPK